MNRHRRYAWPGLVCAAYLIVALAVTSGEYLSETAKIARGTYTDTFSPFFYTNLLSFPVSVLHPAWPGYPDHFSARAFRVQVHDALAPTLLNIVITAAVIGAIGLLTSAQHPRRRVVRPPLAT
jgi:hypothetical protein